MNVILIELLISILTNLPWNVEPGSEPYVLPSQCEHVFYLEVLGRRGWSYVVSYDPRGMLVSSIK
jgi:hypothetical protein